VTFSAYADPKTDGCHREVRMLSMIVVGPKQTAIAKIPMDAAVPETVLPTHKRIIAVKTPQPQKVTFDDQLEWPE